MKKTIARCQLDALSTGRWYLITNYLISLKIRNNNSNNNHSNNNHSNNRDNNRNNNRSNKFRK